MKKSYVKPFVEVIKFQPEESIMDINVGEDGDLDFNVSVPDEW